MALTQRRGGGLSWYTRDTGGVQCSPGHSVHFGVNKSGLINVFAKDIGMLPEWQQRIWAGFNITPEGGVSEELLSAQMRAIPATTQAPEDFLRSEMELLNQECVAVLGDKLFREHEKLSELLQKCHRFRAVDESSLFALAKDMNRLVSDSIDVKLLHNKVDPPQGESRSSLKSLERVLATLISADKAHELLSPLHGIYGLRNADAHLRGADIDWAYNQVGMDTNSPFVHQGHQMLRACVSCIHSIAKVFKASDSETET